nr:PTS sugar transporter subunit IIC [Clostridioides difficile]
MGVLVNNLRRTGNAVLVHKADKYAEEGNTKGIWSKSHTWNFFTFI